MVSVFFDVLARVYVTGLQRSIAIKTVLSVCHSRDAHLNGSTYRNTCQPYDTAMFIVFFSADEFHGREFMVHPERCVKRRYETPLSKAQIDQLENVTM